MDSWGKFLFSASDLLVGLFIRSILKLRRVPDNICTYSVMVWLLDPFTLTFGTRGNCEPIVCAMILWIIICVMNGNVLQAAFWYGLVVHFRIYPSSMHFLLSSFLNHTCSILVRSQSLLIELLAKESQPAAVRL